MPRNIEIKASLKNCNFEEMKKIASELSTLPGEILNQRDTFYKSLDGRLKLRENPDRSFAQLIYYNRPDSEGPKQSKYSITKLDKAELPAFRHTMQQCVGELCDVRKRRFLFLVDQTRIHLDQVEGLGNFLELEVVLRDEETEADGTRVAEALMERLGIQRDWLISGAYADMLMGLAGDT